MTEKEYEDWFERYLGDVENTNSINDKSIISNKPKKINMKIWYTCLWILFIASLIISFTLMLIKNNNIELWYLDWISNALLNISFGVLVSIIFSYFTILREKNITYYNECIPIIEQRYKNIHEAFFQYCFKLDIEFQKGDYEKFYTEVWHAHINTIFVIIEYWEYLIQIFKNESNLYSVTKDKINKVKKELLEKSMICDEEYYKSETISVETYKSCKEISNIGFDYLMELNKFICNLKKDIYNMKFNKRLLTQEEKDFYNKLDNN